MEIKLIVAIISSIVSVILFIPYIVDIFKKKTEPHIYSWLIWTITIGIATVAGFKSGGGYGNLSMSIAVILCGAIFLLSFKKGTKNINTFDLYCLILALSILVFYIFTNDGLTSVIVVSIIDTVAFLPTYRKVFEDPYSETLSLYALSATSYVLDFFALQNYTLTTSIFILTSVAMNGLLPVLVYIKRKRDIVVMRKNA
jgi:hypothetical protein